MIDIHKDIKLRDALSAGKSELAAYYTKEIARLEAELAKKEGKLVPRNKHIRSKKIR